jgi:hypothetical protein
MAVPVKKTRKQAASVKYLLSGDRKLQRLSLKKISDPVKKAKPEARSNRVKPAAGESRPTTGGRLVIVGVVCVLAAAALLAARQPAADVDDISAAGSQEAQASPQQARLTAGVETNTSTTVTPTRAVTAAPAKKDAAAASIDTKTAVAPVKPAERTKVTTSTAVARESTDPVKDAATLTVEGCLAYDEPAYRLKNTSGLNVPRARSWRSGFLMKRSSSIGLIDARGTLKLDDHLGQRVAATGSLVNREMHATTLRVVAASCR